MPSPVEPAAEVDGGSASDESGGGNDDAAPGEETQQRSTARWTDEDWRLWNSGGWWEATRNRAPSTETTPTPDGEHSDGHGTGYVRRSYTTRSSDPWLNPWKDPWTSSQYGSQRDEVPEERGGGNDKIVAPEFSGEEDRDGTRARSYLRKIEAWRRVTRLKPNKQALVLYNGLTGKAWHDAEEIDVKMLDSNDGVEKFIGWITQRYLDKEVVKAGRYMSDFFKLFKRGTNQDIRDYNSEFDRHLTKLKEVGCVLPGVCSSWWYIDKLRLDSATELSLLSSVNNQYDLGRLQEAAVVQDRMNRRLWETGRRSDTKDNKKNQQAYMTELDDIPEDMEDFEDAEDFDETYVPDDEDPEAHEAFVAFQNAKAKYNNMLKARGTTLTKSREEALSRAKARSFCSACGKKGHWHKDAECPKNKGKDAAAAPHVTHVVFYTEGTYLDTIVDCACSRTLAGTMWCRKYIELAKDNGIPYIIINQDETFKFGGPKLYPSKKAIIGWLAIQGRWFLIKIALVAAQVPLLLSRPVLASLGMNYKMDINVADFTKLSLEHVKLDFTTSGHPRVNAVNFGPKVPLWPDNIDWSVTEVHIPDTASAASRAYMASAASVGRVHFFYPKVHGHIFDMLTRDTLPSETFLHWWNQQTHVRDFWVEDDEYMVRVHVTPRRTCFDPGRWNTSDDTLRTNLLKELDECRETTCIPCYGNGITHCLEHRWRHDSSPRADFLWIGRSRFRRRRTTEQTCCPTIRPVSDVQDRSQVAMEDDSCRAHPTDGGSGHPSEVRVDCAGAEGDSLGDAGHQGGPHLQSGRHLAHVAGRLEGEVQPGGHPLAAATHTGATHEAAAGEHPTDRRGEGVLRELQGLHVQGGQLELPELGGEGGGDEPQPQPRLGTSGSLGTSREVQAPSRWNFFREWGSRTFGRSADSSGGASQGQAQDGEEHHEDSENIEDSASDVGFRGIQPGVGARDEHGGSDQGHGVATSGAEGRQSGGGQEGQGVLAGASKVKMKKKAYWDKVDQLHKMRIEMNRRSCYITAEHDALDELYNVGETTPTAELYVPEENTIFEAEQDSDVIDLDDYDTDKETGHPRIKLTYPEDYDEVRNLPSKRMKRVAKKRVKGWVHRALLCLTTTLVALSTPVVAELNDAILEPAKDLCKAVLGPNALQGKKEEIALLELFAGSAHLTMEFARQGHHVLEPRDILYGHNLFDPLQQESVFNDIQYKRPKLLWIALPCTKWSTWQRYNYAHRKQQLRRERQKQRRLVHFAVEAAWHQVAMGNEVMFEHPKYSDMWTDPSMQSFMECEHVVAADLDMCRYDLRAVTDGGRLRKPTKVVATNPNLVKELTRTCHGGHEHTPTEGRNTKAAGIYTRTFCKAVIEGYKNTDRSVWFQPGDHAAAKTTWENYVANNEGDLTTTSGNNMSGIEFPENVPATLGKALRRVHQNLGHPANHDLARHLKLSGASEAAVKAAQGLRCTTCNRKGNPGTRRPAKLARPMEFNQEVCLDTLNLLDSEKKKVEVLSIVDTATGYHVVKKIRGRKSADLLADFTDAWLTWAGPPLKVTCDQERGFIKDFVDGLEMVGIQVRFIAGQAHWQQGIVERQGQWYRAIWDRTIAHSQPLPHEIEYTLAMVSAAKNNLRRKHGYSPAQWLFGAEPRLGDAMLDEDANLYTKEELRSPNEVWRRRQAIRLAAREAFMQTQADDALKRALLGRPRADQEIYEQGDYVYIFSQQDDGWCGTKTPKRR